MLLQNGPVWISPAKSSARTSEGVVPPGLPPRTALSTGRFSFGLPSHVLPLSLLGCKLSHFFSINLEGTVGMGYLCWKIAPKHTICGQKFNKKISGEGTNGEERPVPHLAPRCNAHAFGARAPAVPLSWVYEVATLCSSGAAQEWSAVVCETDCISLLDHRPMHCILMASPILKLCQLIALFGGKEHWIVGCLRPVIIGWYCRCTSVFTISIIVIFVHV